MVRSSDSVLSQYCISFAIQSSVVVHLCPQTVILLEGGTWRFVRTDIHVWIKHARIKQPSSKVLGASREATGSIQHPAHDGGRK